MINSKPVIHNKSINDIIKSGRVTGTINKLMKIKIDSTKNHAARQQIEKSGSNLISRVSPINALNRAKTIPEDNTIKHFEIIKIKVIKWLCCTVKNNHKQKLDYYELVSRELKEKFEISNVFKLYDQVDSIKVILDENILKFNSS